MFTSLKCRLDFTRCSALGKRSSRTSIRDDYFAIANRWVRLSTVTDYQDRFAAAGDFDSSSSSFRRTSD